MSNGIREEVDALALAQMRHQPVLGRDRGISRDLAEEMGSQPVVRRHLRPNESVHVGHRAVGVVLGRAVEDTH